MSLHATLFSKVNKEGSNTKIADLQVKSHITAMTATVDLMVHSITDAYHSHGSFTPPQSTLCDVCNAY